MQEPIEFKCPVCESPLILQTGSYLCVNRHTYDRAKAGYVNLLLVQNKSSRNPGDNQAMILSRQSFLNKGYYQLLADKLAALILGNDSAQKLLDLGCGEGYYLQNLASTAAQKKRELALAGIDISKEAIKQAAKRKLNALLAVASTYDPPFFAERFDSLLSVFSPLSPEQAARLLNKQGKLIMVGPGKEHLLGLTRHIYTEIIPHAGNHQLLENVQEFKLIEQFALTENLKVKSEDILDLLTMTPYYWQTKPEQKAHLASLSHLETPIHFEIKVYAKQS
jgi:23S rRNA (guanine745-N1)-methyltransferase